MLVTVDTGGTKTLIASFEQDGTMGESIKFPTPLDQNEYLSLLRKTLNDNYGDKTVEAVVLAVPGVVRNGVMIGGGNLGWKNFDLKKALTGVLGSAPVLIENDANLAGLGETRILDPMPISALYVTISTGIGTGMIINGQIEPGMRHSEGGAMMLANNGRLETWESFASGKAINIRYKKFAKDITSEETWNEIAERISRGFLAVVPIIQPEVIIIGGSIGTYFERYSIQLSAIIQSSLLPHIAMPMIQQAKYPEEAVIYGAYYYALDYLASL